MARYDKTKKYWLQLKEDWFEEDAIRWLEDQKNGKEYSLFYMKLMLKSIKTNGILIRQVGKMLIPYEPQSIADLTRTELDTVIVAMELLKKISLVEILEDGAIYIEQVSKMIGFATEGAIRKQLQREKTQENQLGWTIGGQMSTKDKDKDIIKDKDKKTDYATAWKDFVNSKGEDFKIAWKSFMEFRKGKKGKDTDYALYLLTRDMQKFTLIEEEQTEIINNSLKSKWTGIYALKNKPVQNTQVKKSETYGGER